MNNNIKNNTIRHFISFLKVPDFFKEKDITFKDKLVIILKVFLITLLGLFIVNVINSLVFELVNVKKTTHVVEKIAKSTKNDELRVLYLSLLFIFMPILEEFIFRYPLGNFKRRKVMISVSLLSGLYLNKLFSSYWYSQLAIAYPLMTYINIFFIAIIIYLILKALFRLLRFNLNLEKIWTNKFTLIFYFFAICFMFNHLGSVSIANRYLIPLTLLPYFIMSMSLGYIRIKLGIFYSIMLHYLFNIPSIIYLIVAVQIAY